MDRSFSGKVALIAGGTGGLGQAVTRAFLDAGAVAAVTYRRVQEFDALRESMKGDAERLSGHSADVTDSGAARVLVDDVVARHGRIDALVNAVGGYAGGSKAWDVEDRVLDQMLLLNLRSGFALTRAVVPVMIRQGHGAIVNVASRAALVHGAGEAAYAASKAAAVAWIGALAADLKGTPVRANSILPSIIDTEANRRAMPRADFAKWPRPEDIARVILFLCSDDAGLVRGAAIPVYGDTGP